MSKKITINAAPGFIKIKNIYDAAKEKESDLALRQLQTLPDDAVFNTGKSALGDPHIDANYVAENVGKSIIKNEAAWKAEHTASIRLYKSNSYVHLLPGDALNLEVRSGEEAAYYLTLGSDLIEVTAGEEASAGIVEEKEEDEGGDDEEGEGSDPEITPDSSIETPQVIAGGEVTLNCSITVDETSVESGTFDAVVAEGDAKVTITGGTYDGGHTPLGGAGNTAVFAKGDATVNIEDGTFKIGKLADGDTGHIDLIYAKENATINISGGTFEGEDETVWLLNLKDADRETAKIVVTGGKFKNWNPADNAAEGPGTNFVAEGYTVSAEDSEDGSTWYTVIPETA